MIIIIVISIFLVIFLIFGKKGYDYYQKIFASNVTLKKDSICFIYIPTGSTLEDVVGIMDEGGILKDKDTFIWLARIKNYPNHIYPGKYTLSDRMNNNELITLLRSGSQTPVQVVFNYTRTKEQFALKISRQIEADSIDVLSIINNESFLTECGYNPETVISVFIPNTYELYWNTSAEQFFERMLSEYKRFWTEDRKARAEEMDLGQLGVSILASIIDEETTKNDEKPKIAGVYMNRFKMGMPLQACPTIKYAMDDWSLTRILDKHLVVESRYNTYINKGLPPGPITFPSVAGIEAVLNYEKHNYLFFAAKDDFSGYHYFSKILAQHNIYSARYQEALEEQRNKQ